MRLPIAAAILALAALGMYGQQHQKFEINTETEEGKLLQMIGEENGTERKMLLMDSFIQKFPAHGAAGWVYSQIQAAYAKAGNSAKVVEIGDKLVAMDPLDLDGAYAGLKAAEALKNVDLIIRWSGLTSDAARKTAALPQPSDADQVEAWKQRVDYAKQVDTYTEYSLFAAALANQQKILPLFEALEKHNPKSPYIGQLAGAYIVAINQSGADKVLPAAERLLGHDPSNPDLLLIVADAYMNQHQNPKALAASNKLIEVMKDRPAPQGVQPADWQNKQNLSLGRAYWYIGIIYAGDENWGPADQALRAAMPYIKSNEALSGPALFYLGLANYRMGKGKDKAKMADALKFSEQAAAIKGPLQAKAAQNLKAIKEGK